MLSFNDCHLSRGEILGSREILQTSDKGVMLEKQRVVLVERKQEIVSMTSFGVNV